MKTQTIDYQAIAIDESPPLLTGKELILASKKYAVEDRRRSWMETISTLLLLVAAFVGTYVGFPWPIRIAASILSGLLIVKFFVIYHDYLHRAILQKSAVAEAIMTLFGLFVLAPKTIWKRTHDHHHHHNSKLSSGGIGSYPLVSKEDFYRLSPKRQFAYLAARHPLTIFFGYLTLFLYDFNVKSLLKNPRVHWDSLVALLLHISIGGLMYYAGGLSTLAVSWFLPFLLAHGLGSYLFYVQHNFPEAIFEENAHWEYTEAAMRSTSFLVMGSVMNYFTGNIGYHHVHHVNHRIPFYRLREAMEQMPELQHPTTVTLHPRDVVRCLRLKVWDPDRQQMVGL